MLLVAFGAAVAVILVLSLHREPGPSLTFPPFPGLRPGHSSRYPIARGRGPTLYVDAGSRGGRCSDSLDVSDVTAGHPWCTIGQAVASAPSGSTVILRAGAYPYQRLHEPHYRGGYVTFEPYGYGTSSPETVTIAGVSTANTSYLRFQGLHFVGSDAGGRYVPGVQIWLNSQNIQLINNDISGQGIVTQAANNVLIQGNYIHNIVRTCGMGEPDGFGVHLSGGTLPSVSHNISLIGNTIADYSQTAVSAGNINNFLMQGNDVSTTMTPSGKVQCGDHVDTALHGRRRQGPVTVIDNNFHDGTQSIIRNVTGLTYARNLLVRIDAWLQLEADPAAAIVNNTWSGGNTLCTGCGSLLLLDYAPGSNWTKPPFNYSTHLNGTIVENNIMREMGIAGVTASEYHEDYDILTDTNRTRTSGIQGSHTLYTPVQFTNRNYAPTPRSPLVDSADSRVLETVPSTRLDYAGQAPWDAPTAPNRGRGPISYLDRGAVEMTSTDR